MLFFSIDFDVNKIYLCDSGGKNDLKDVLSAAHRSPFRLFQASISMGRLMSLVHGQVLRL